MSVSKKLYPWFQQTWSELTLNQVPHAMLLHGQAGIGKFDFALHLAKALLCESPIKDKPCCECEACHWFDAGNHPDFLGLVPEDQFHLLPHEMMAGDDEKPKKSKKKTEDDTEKPDKKASSFIKVEQIRDALDGINTAPHRGKWRVVLISPIETLQAVSANTLLKILEEPPQSTLFILVSDRLDRILPTIRSRCRLLTLNRPSKQMALDWLALELVHEGVRSDSSHLEEVLGESGGAVLDARARLLKLDDAVELHQQITFDLLKGLEQGSRIDWLATSELVYKAPMSVLLIGLERWIADILGQQQAGYIRYYPTRSSSIIKCAEQVNSNKLSEFWRLLLDARRHELHALANRVQIEALLIRYQDLFK